MSPTFSQLRKNQLQRLKGDSAIFGCEGWRTLIQKDDTDSRKIVDESKDRGRCCRVCGRGTRTEGVEGLSTSIGENKSAAP
jgi:hypothetical protein